MLTGAEKLDSRLRGNDSGYGGVARGQGADA